MFTLPVAFGLDAIKARQQRVHRAALAAQDRDEFNRLTRESLLLLALEMVVAAADVEPEESPLAGRR